ncbi:MULTISPECIES: NAD(P)-binding domain-containing protein [unclassified Leucobacter]|uniref:NAD(P)-binding domain-containing protein n=1 Tax=unclassified Leucobacter TaxID=2621730 RepID=UPI000621DABC|nr:NAD(P)-binding domain-containing protein [Leucobacter sp. Ag1]KKI21374.1 pyridine nucleotide-disulfide oxidoreductase [Leucobacter sp. Ag1]
MSRDRRATVVVIGAGQAGLSAGYHLQRHGFASALLDPEAARSFVILDGEARPGGAWQHRWASLTMATVNRIFDLPGFRQTAVDPATSSREAVPGYFAAFEAKMRLPILRPVSVAAVRRADTDPDGELLIESSAGLWRARAVINATGTWRNPVLPEVPGANRFLGRQLHTRDYVSLDEFAGRSVAVVGGGISAVQQLEEISRVARVAWYTRREPVFLDGDFSPEVEGRETIERVTADVEAGNPSRSVVSYTGLAWTPYARAARDRGVLVRRPMFTAIEPHGVREADGSFTSVDTILWATGFRPSIAHLDPLGLRNERGGIEVRGTRVVAEPRVHLIGYGPSQSTVGANRAGRDAVAEIDAVLRSENRIPQM